MIHTTHAAFGAALMETILVAEHAPVTWQAAAAVTVAFTVAPFPDIDQPESWVSRHVPFGSVVSMFIRHRTLTHSLAVTVALYLVLFDMGVRIPGWLATGIIVGWTSHWLIDLLNPMGVQLFYPLPIWVRPPIPWLAIGVESPGEAIIRLVIQVYAVSLGASYGLLHLPGAVRETGRFVMPYASRLVEAVSLPWLADACRWLHLTA
ncbi:metal-dependent hydrolase [Alicyclobacillus macrosporangiidus]|uniref:Inner membrane protein n=1 Tax=Alicyclobacillus macrosporangiidus TaxID=392015 RepID=A0A1I7LL27_9BACL|nr:metal-dependent hydrolase [Alicyclobacillus macrosporangiidus]SFV10426.1 inner membrane protein [Alicyclobacillus macrosporangiidus]